MRQVEERVKHRGWVEINKTRDGDKMALFKEHMRRYEKVNKAGNTRGQTMVEEAGGRVRKG